MIMNVKQVTTWRRRSLSNSRYHPRILLDRLRKTMNTVSQNSQ